MHEESLSTYATDLLRREGFTAADVLAIVEVTADDAYVSRIADGLGVQVESAQDEYE